MAAAGKLRVFWARWVVGRPANSYNVVTLYEGGRRKVKVQGAAPKDGTPGGLPLDYGSKRVTL